MASQSPDQLENLLRDLRSEVAHLTGQLGVAEAAAREAVMRSAAAAKDVERMRASLDAAAADADVLRAEGGAAAARLRVVEGDAASLRALLDTFGVLEAGH